MLTKPVGRGAFLAGKLLALALTLAIATGAGGMAAYVYTSVLFSAPDPVAFAAMCALLWLSLLVYAALTFLGSTLARSVLPAATLGLVFLAVVGAVSLLPTVGQLTPGGLTGIAQKVGTGQPVDGVAAAVLVAIAVIVAALGAAWWSFRGQEL